MSRKDERHQVERRQRLAGTRRAMADAVKEAARQKYEQEKAQVLGRAREQVERYREDHPAPNRDARFADPGERRVNNLVPAPGKPGSRGRRGLPPMSPGADPGAPK